LIADSIDRLSLGLELMADMAHSLAARFPRLAVALAFPGFFFLAAALMADADAGCSLIRRKTQAGGCLCARHRASLSGRRLAANRPAARPANARKE
jgi:hypothetical protein